MNDEEPFVYYRDLDEDEDEKRERRPARRGGEVRFANRCLV